MCVRHVAAQVLGVLIRDAAGVALKRAAGGTSGRGPARTTCSASARRGVSEHALAQAARWKAGKQSTKLLTADCCQAAGLGLNRLMPARPWPLPRREGWRAGHMPQGLALCFAFAHLAGQQPHQVLRDPFKLGVQALASLRRPVPATGADVQHALVSVQGLVTQGRQAAYGAATTAAAEARHKLC